MNEVLKTIADRYSCRDFETTPLTEEQIKSLVEAALASPSARNEQPWQVIVVTDKKLIEELDADGVRILSEMEDKTYYERVSARGGKMLYDAPCLIMIASNGSEYADIDCGILTQSLTLAAHSIGLGSVVIGLLKIPLAGPRGDEFKKRMNFPEGYGFGISVLVGTVKSGKEPHELDMSKVTYIKG